MTPVRVTPSAADDISAIAAFIAQDSVERAVAFIDYVYGRCDSLGVFPKRGRRRPEHGARMRSFPVPPVTVFYRLASDESEVVVVHVVLGGRFVEAVFGPTS